MVKIDLLITGIRQLVTFADYRPGEALDRDTSGIIEDAAVAVKGGVIIDAGPEDSLRGRYKARETLDAEGGLVTPGLIDVHTHMVFAGSREDEFEMKLKGYTYQEILAAGGGIHRTVKATQAASEEALLERARRVARIMVEHGTTTVEVKGGYGLTLEGEAKILRAARRLARAEPIDVVTTVIAHVVPRDFPGGRKAYLSYYIEDLLPAIAEEGLADFSDVFCDKGAFTPEETGAVIEASARLGLPVRIHADQLEYIGCSRLAGRYKIVALDHLDVMPPENAGILADAGSYAGLTPTSTLAMFSKARPPIDALRRHGVPMALGSDYNPNNMTPTVQHAMDLSTYLYGLTPLEALAGATVVAAESLLLRDRGRIAPGLKADIVIWNVPSYQWIGYTWGYNKVKATIKDGKIVYMNR